ncbi:MAG TPA: sigma-70 family RNA polymerase sigma factor [Clostridia bacterium]|nr:sigma-70 family RNA polymerase sigma factor [Clostridia bacterium]
MQPVFLSGFRIGIDILMEMTNTDLDLLARYTRQHAEDAFAEIVRRHLDLVFSAALRQVRSPQLAEEVAQSAFTDLARQAHRLAPGTVLTAWLYQVTRRTAIDVVRREARRQLREHTAYELTAMNTAALSGQNPMEPDADWTHIEPLLDEAMEALGEPDRAAVLLRYFENKSLREVGQILGTNEDAARKRVSRAVERLREFLAKRGVAAGASGLVIVISANAVQAAPAGLAATISTFAMLGGTALLNAATATKAIAMTVLQKAILTATIAAAVGTGIYQARQASAMRNQVQALQQQQAPLSEQLSQLKTENERLSNQVAEAKDSQALSQAQLNDLLRLRGKVAQLQTDSRELAKLKSTVAQQPGKVPDFIQASIAAGMAAGLKIAQKDALARVSRMKQMLNLTDDQEQAVVNVITNRIPRQSQLTMDMMMGKLTPEQYQAQAGALGNQEAEIKALLTPEQLAAYPQYQQAEKTTAADKSATSEASQIADKFSLPKDQQETLRALLYELNLKERVGAPNQQAITQAKQSGNMADVARMSIELENWQLEEKLKILGGVFSPEQMATYRQEQTDRINKQADMMKMFLPQKPADATN